MLVSRLLHIKNAALRAKRTLDRFGSVRRNLLPYVSIYEQKELSKSHPNLARWTRSFHYDNSVYIEDVNRMSPSKLPTVKEFWVGSRSLACLAEDDDGRNLAHRQLEQEDQAELTDLQTILYHDPVEWDMWLEGEVRRRILQDRNPDGSLRWGKKFLSNHIVRASVRHRVLKQVPIDGSGEPVKVMLMDDETGELRPVRNGDVVQTAHGSNEDLDALYMDEPTDPRTEDDSRIRELLRDRINPNSDFEQEMLNDRHMAIPSREDPRAHDELTLRRKAAEIASNLIAVNPDLEPQFLDLRLRAYRWLKRPFMKFARREGHPQEGMWLTPAHLWADAEEHIIRLRKHYERKERVAPKAVDWDKIRGL